MTIFFWSTFLKVAIGGTDYKKKILLGCSRGYGPHPGHFHNGGFLTPEFSANFDLLQIQSCYTPIESKFYAESESSNI